MKQNEERAKIEKLDVEEFVAPAMDCGHLVALIDTRDLKVQHLAEKINELVEVLNEK